MSAVEDQPEYLTLDEVWALMDTISDADYRRLERQSAFMSLSVPGMSGNDLLHEALVRLREGRRQWKRSLDLGTTVYMIMESVARDARKGAKAAPIDRFAVVAEEHRDEDEEGDAQETAVAVATGSPEEIAGARQLLVHLEQLAAGDAHEEAVVLSWALGLSAKEAARESGISETDYDSARKRIERKLAKFEKKVGQ